MSVVTDYAPDSMGALNVSRSCDVSSRIVGYQRWRRQEQLAVRRWTDYFMEA